MELNQTITAIVTGGASGLGAATARALAACGVRVALFDLDEAQGAPLADTLGGVFCRVDVTREDSVEAGYANARAALGQERILVNCAGGGNAIRTAQRDKQTGAIRAFPLEAFRRVVELNLVGTFACLSRSAAGMMTLDPLADGERGVVINTASVAAEDGQVGQAAYAASKAGVAGLTLPVARDLMNEGVRVNTILPGIFATPLMLSAPPALLQALGDSIPFPRRLGRPEEYAQLALGIVRNAYLNGACIRLDGAIRMPPR